MTNEELAMEIRAGRAGYGQLWEQAYKFIRQRARRFFVLYGGTCDRAGVELDDLLQCGFLALQDAVEAYKPESGYSLLSFITYPLQNRFREVCGIRTSRRDPLNNCDSLDREVIGDGADSEITLGELQEDAQAAAMMEDVIEQSYQSELRDVLETAIATLPTEQRDTLRRRYYDDLTQDGVAAVLGMTREQVRQTEQKALRGMRKPSVARSLQSFHDEIISDYAWHGTGWGAWNSTGASSVERATEKAEGVSPCYPI